MKFLKRFIPLLLSICFIAGICMSGCKKKPDEPSTPTENPAENGYTFTVKYPDGRGVNGITEASGSRNARMYIMLCDANGNFMDNSLSLSLTERDSANVNASGIANFKCEPGEYTVVIENAPYGYHVGDYKTDSEHENYEINLVHNKITYTANLTDENGNAASNVSVKISEGDNLLHTVTTDANGKAVFPELNSGVYAINASSDGYTSKTHTTALRDAYELTNDVDVNINLIPFTHLELNDSAKLNNEQSDVMNSVFNSSLLTLFNDSIDSFIYNADIGEGEEVFYAFTPEYSATYTLYIYGANKNNASRYHIKSYGNTIDNIDPSEIRTNIGTGCLHLYCEAGVPYFFSCSRVAEEGQVAPAGQYSFVISTPDFTKEKYQTTEPGTYAQTYRASNQLFAFRPAVSGIYQITTDSSIYDTFAENLGKANNVIDTDDDSGEGKNFMYEFEVKDTEVGNEYTFRISLKNLDGSEVTLPAEFNVIVTRIGNATPDESVTVQTVTATATEKCTESGSKFVWLPLNGSLRPHQGDDGLWYVTVNGVEKKLMVSLSKDLTSGRTGYSGDDTDLSFATIEYKGSESAAPGESGSDDSRKNNNLTVYEDITTTQRRYSYTSFIEHYTGYKNGKPVSGAGICNSDGLYVVNEELHTFLTRFFAVGRREGTETNIYRQQGHALVALFAENANQVLDNGCGWYVACGYYE